MYELFFFHFFNFTLKSLLSRIYPIIKRKHSSDRTRKSLVRQNGDNKWGFIRGRKSWEVLGDNHLKFGRSDVGLLMGKQVWAYLWESKGHLLTKKKTENKCVVIWATWMDRLVEPSTDGVSWKLKGKPYQHYTFKSILLLKML